MTIFPSDPFEEEPSPEQRLGDLMLSALDEVRGRELVGALLLVLVDAGEDQEGNAITELTWHPLPGQLHYTSLGMATRVARRLAE